MKCLLQRVTHASVRIDDKVYSSIQQGLCLFLGISKMDATKDIDYLTRKILNLRIFEDEDGKMNKSVLDIHGEILVVSQFTLYGNCEKGRRPSFGEAALPEDANTLYQEFVTRLKQELLAIKTGVLGASMKIDLVNDGPSTFLLESPIRS